MSFKHQLHDNEVEYYENPVALAEPPEEEPVEESNVRPEAQEEAALPQLPVNIDRLSAEEQGDQAFEIHNYLVRLRGDTSKFDMETARQVHLIKDKKLYQILGCDTFESYLAQPEINMSRASAFQMASVYKKYVIELGMNPAQLLGAGIPKLATMKKYVTPDNALELIQTAEGMSRSDLRETLSEMFDDPKVKRPNKNLEPLADELFKAIKSGDPQLIEEAMDNYSAAKYEIYGDEWTQ